VQFPPHTCARLQPKASSSRGLIVLCALLVAVGLARLLPLDEWNTERTTCATEGIGVEAMAPCLVVIREGGWLIEATVRTDTGTLIDPAPHRPR